MQTFWDRTCWVVTGVMLASAAWAGIARAQDDDKDDTYELMSVFVDTFQQIDRNYFQEVDRRKLMEAAMRGMLAELDPYSDYIAPEDLPQFTEAISQEFGGVGIRVELDEEQRAIKVVAPLPGSPAYEAGIHAGDRITEIAGRPVKEFDRGREIDTAIEMLRGKPGEEVEVTVQHLDATDVEKITLKREQIQLPTVLGDSYGKEGNWNWIIDPDKKIGYLRLTHFTRRSAAEVRDVVRQLKKEGMRGLIIDLRFNPGGLLQSALDISDLFIESGIIVSTKGRNTPTRDWPAKSFGTFTGFPIAIIINRFSASASEILAAALQDHHRAIIVGERSWGKGSVQDVIDLEDGKSALKLTTASYHRPSGKNIHRLPNAKETDEWGVVPDEGYKVEFSAEDLKKYQEDRRQRDLPDNTAASSFEDKQLKAALEAINKQLEAPGTAKENPPEKEEKPAPPENKKAAQRLPLIPVPRGRVG